MKKRISLLLALALLLSLGSAALAEGTGDSHTYTDPENDHTSLEQTITTTIPDNKLTWYLEIPSYRGQRRAVGQAEDRSRADL